MDFLQPLRVPSKVCSEGTSSTHTVKASQVAWASLIFNVDGPLLPAQLDPINPRPMDLSPVPH